MDIAADDGVDARAHRSTNEVIAHAPEPSTREEPCGVYAAGEPEIRALRGRALARAAHALKTPLAVIKGSATTLLSNAGRWDLATQQEMLQLIDGQVDRLHELVTGLLDVWRLEGALLPVRLEPTCVLPFLEELALGWADAAPTHPVRLVLPAQLPSVPLDPQRMRQALDRLIAYAIQAASPGTSVTIEARVGAGELLLLVGWRAFAPPSEALAQLLEPFSPGDGADESADTSLGLATARAIIHAHGGRIAPGGRTPAVHQAFEIVLPLGAATASGTPASGTPASGGAVPAPLRRVPSRGHGRRERPVVLIADDDQHLARYLRANLEAQGYRALVAPNALQMARVLDLEDPNLVLLDATLTGKVRTTTPQLLHECGDVPTIVLGGSDEAECVRALDLGATDYLAKPFGLQELLARVRAALRSAAHEGAGDGPKEPFQTGDLVIDFAQRQVSVGGCVVQLSRTEYNLLRVLAEHAGRVLTHGMLLEQVWGPGYGHEVEFLWVYARRLRRKIEPDPHQPRYLLTVPGVGYRLAQVSPSMVRNQTDP